MANLSSMHVFKQDCDEMITNYGSMDIVKANKMISLTANIVKKYPFVFLPDFVEDFMNGVFTRHMVKKYQMRSYNDFTMVATALNFKGDRSKDPNKDNKMINLQNKKWANQYEFLTEQSNIFAKPLEELFHANILGALVSNVILDLEYIDSFDLKKIILNSYKKYKNSIPALYNNKIRDSFEKYLNDDLDYKLNNSVNYLADESYITSMDGDVSLPAKYSKLSDKVYSIINEMEEGLSYNSLMVKSMNEFPLIRITARVQIIDDILDELERKLIIVRNRTYWKYSPDSDQLFSVENYNRKMEKIKKEVISAGRTKFFGRNITPDQFISEIKTMETGDLDDLDDQVTRIAGLVLSDAVMLQSPRENMKKFDFIVDLTNYNFRPEQVKIMKEMDFQATSNIFHCKVMIEDDITSEILSSLKNAIPPKEQGVIFTCTKANPEILQQTRDDRRIQVIDEDGIRSWCSITPTIPCRLHSVAKVMYGESRGKIVLIKSLNYESGLATVETAPDHLETTFPIGCMQEVDLHILEEDDFESASDKFFKFVCNLANLSTYSFEDVIDREIKTHNTWDDLQKSLHPELFDSTHSNTERNSRTKRPSNRIQYFEFDNGVYVSIRTRSSINDAFHCSCGHKLNENYFKTLCKHQLAAIYLFCQSTHKPWSEINHSIDKLDNEIFRFKEDNITNSIHAIKEVCNPDSDLLLKEYLQAHIDNEQT